MKLRATDIALGLTAVVAIAAGLVLAVPAMLTPPPRLDALPELLRTRKYDQAERLVRAYLREHPASVEARWRLAQVLIERIERSNPKDERSAERRRQDVRDLPEVLALLKSVKPRTSHEAAVVEWLRGTALYHLDRWDEAEAAWRRALEKNPRIGEVGWALLDMYYIQGRKDEARRLALRQHRAEPDRHDQASYLVELIREDAQPPEPESLVRLLGPIVRGNPKDLRSTVALGLAQVHSGQVDAGLATLQHAVEEHPDDPNVWDGWLTGLGDSGRPPDELEKAVAALPKDLAAQPRFQVHLGRVAQDQRDWKQAADHYLRAWKALPSSPELAYRLSRTLRMAGQSAASRTMLKQFETRISAYESARTRIRELYKEAAKANDLGVAPHPDLYHRLADLREQMGHPEEAAAWHQLALRDNPNDPISRAALERLEDEIRRRQDGGSPDFADRHPTPGEESAAPSAVP